MPNKYFVLICFSTLLTACAGNWPPVAAGKVYAACPIPADSEISQNAAESNSGQSTGLDSTPQCAETVSVYSNKIWLPIFGPLWDSLSNTDVSKKSAWYTLSTLLPVIGPAAQQTFGEKRCIAQCLAEPEVVAPADEAGKKAAAERLKIDLNAALKVSEVNCRLYLDGLVQQAMGSRYANLAALHEKADGSDAAEDQLLPALIETIKANRSKAEKLLICSPLSSAEVVAKIGSYDGLCSTDSALDAMLYVANLQNKRDSSSGRENMYVWLEKKGLTTAAVTDTPKEQTVPNPDCPTHQTDRSARPHIMNLNRKKAESSRIAVPEK
jgi:hypothetical protein